MPTKTKKADPIEMGKQLAEYLARCEDSQAGDISGLLGPRLTWDTEQETVYHALRAMWTVQFWRNKVI